MTMPTKHLYISEADMEVITKMEEILKEQGESLSGFLVEAAKNHVAVHESTEDIELEGFNRKRIFKGKTLLWHDNSDYEQGVFWTAKDRFVYWWWCPNAIDRHNQEVFKIFNTLAELKDAELLGEDDMTEVEDEYASLNDQKIVDRLDI